MTNQLMARAIAFAFLLPAAAQANDSDEMEKLRGELQEMKKRTNRAFNP